MREIKFRAWDGDTMFHFSLDNMEDEARLMKANHWEMMQYTGLKDKNGKEIYEGDILKQKHGAYCKVFWNEGGFWIKNDDGSPGGHIPLVVYLDFEVIGNIYENPELLNQ